MRRKIQPILICITVVFGLVGCSEPTKELVRATVQTAPRITRAPLRITTVPPPPATIQLTVPMTATQNTTPPPPIDPTLVGVADAALAAHDEFQRQLVSPRPEWSLEKLRAVMTPTYADFNFAFLSDIETIERRRYESGTVEERLVLRVRASTSEPGVAFAVVCWRNNSIEFDTNGTPNPSDDLKLQSDLELFAYQAKLVLVGNTWLNDDSVDLEKATCANAF